MGEDNLSVFQNGKTTKLLIKNHQIIVYPRVLAQDTDKESITHKNICKINAPIIELSATEIRKMIREKKNVRPMLPPEVFEHIDTKGFYQILISNSISQS